MYYAITIMDDGIITDRHESMRVITADMFAESEYYAGQEVVEISHEDEYQGGHWLDEYVGGKLLPLVDRIIVVLGNQIVADGPREQVMSGFQALHAAQPPHPPAPQFRGVKVAVTKPAAATDRRAA